MGFLEMTPIHLISWGGTKMAHFLEDCILFNKLLAPHHRDRLFSLNNRKQRDTVYSRKDIQRFVSCISYFHDKQSTAHELTQLVLKVYKIDQDKANRTPGLATSAGTELSHRESRFAVVISKSAMKF